MVDLGLSMLSWRPTFVRLNCVGAGVGDRRAVAGLGQGPTLLILDEIGLMFERLVGVSLLRHFYNSQHQFDCVFAADRILSLLDVLFEVCKAVSLNAIHTLMVNLLDCLTNPLRLRFATRFYWEEFEVLAPVAKIG